MLNHFKSDVERHMLDIFIFFRLVVQPF